ncbi:MAG: PAS domain-containing sensor histidine kinase [Caldilineaceae bacterium]
MARPQDVSTQEHSSASSIWYESLFLHSLDGVILADAITRAIIAVNPEACRMLGYEETALVGCNVFALVDQSDPRVTAAAESRFRTGGFRGELTGRRADGTLFPAEMSSITFTAPDGRQLAAFFFRDISQRKQAEDALAASQAMYRLLAENSSDIVWMLDAGENLVYMSPNIGRLVGDDAGKQQALGMADLLQLIHPDDRARLAAQAASDGALHLPTSRVEYRVRSVDGSYLWVEDRALREFDSEGRLVRTIVNTREITERKCAELALLESENKYRDLYDKSPDMYFSTYPSDHLIHDCNLTLATTLGYAREELIGQPTNVLFTPASLDYIVSTLPALVATQHISHLDVQLRHRDGSLIDALASVVLERVVDGPPLGRVTLKDISERKRMEVALKESERALRAANEELEQRVAERTAELRHAVAELERANAGKDAFMAAVSHELRTPLTGIISMADALDTQIRGPLNERQQQYVAAIQSSSARLLEVINAVLDYTTAVADQRPPKAAPCQLAELCAAAVALVQPKVAKKQQSIDVAVEPPNLQIQSDSNTILSILEALLDNAVKFTPPGGRLGIKIHHAAVPHPAVQIEVWDSGIGIQEHHKPYLFKPFTQIDQRLSRQYEGMGLGLAIVHRKAEILGGTVSVETTVDRGSRFIVTLPAIA